MSKFKKYLVGSVGVIGLSMALVGCSGDGSSSEDVISGSKVNMSEGDTLEYVSELAGPEVIKKSLLYGILDKYYKVSDEEVKKNIDNLNKVYEDVGGIKGFMEYYGYNDEDLKNVIKNELLVTNAFKDLRGYDEKDFKAKYEEIKNSKKSLEVVVLKETETSNKVIKLLETEKDIKKLEEAAGKELGNNIFVEEMNYVKGEVEEEEYEVVFDTAVGDIVEIKNKKSDFNVHLKVVEDIVISLEDAKLIIEYDLLYGDLADPEEWLFAKLVEEKKLKLGKKYEYLYDDNSEAIEALSQLEDIGSDLEKVEKEKEEKEKEDK